MNLAGECAELNSGREYLSRWPSCGAGSNTTLTPWCLADDYKGMVQAYCQATYATGDKSDMDPYYGQCVAPTLSISAGTLGKETHIALFCFLSSAS